MSVYKPCPFCGHKQTYMTDERVSPIDVYQRVNCVGCTASVVGRYAEEAIGEWNKRHQPIEPLYYPSEQMTSLTMLTKRHADLAGKYGKALQALREVGENFENIDSRWVTELVKELEGFIK